MAKTKTSDKTHKYVHGDKQLGQYDLGSVDSLIEWLNSCKAEIPADAVDPYLSLDMDYYPSYYDSRDYYLKCSWGYWLEYTPQELEERKEAFRLRSEAARKAAQTKKEQEEARDKEEYERLKKKFEV